MSFDNGDNLYVAGTFNLDVYEGGLKSNGVPAIVLEAPTSFSGVAVDHRGRVYLTVSENQIDVLPSLPTNYQPIRTITSPVSQKLITTIAVGR